MQILRYLCISLCVFIAGYIVVIQFGKAAKSPDQLIVGTASGYAPFVSLNNQGEYEGFDIDVAQELAKRLNKKLVLRDMGSMVPLMLALKNESVDILMWALEINQVRLKEMAMVHYQGGNTTSYPLVFWQKIPATIKSLDDLKTVPQAVICIEPGSSQERFLSKFNFITTKPMEKVVDMLLDLKYGKSLAALLDPSLIKDLMQKNPELKVLDIALDKDSMSFGNGICIKKENKQLIEQVTQAIQSMKSDGTINRFEKKWNIDR